MTDNEIIKAWEEKITLLELGESAPLSIEFVTNTLDLINCQKAEIKRLDKKADELFVQNCRLCRHNGVLQDRINELKKAKAEAIKEFAERLKDKHRHNTTSIVSLVTVFDNINKLVKEMGAE
jgi:hypothetical protein